MSEIPKSQRKPTKIDYKDQTIKMTQRIREYLDVDFGPANQYDAEGKMNLIYESLKEVRQSIDKVLNDLEYNMILAENMEVSNMRDCEIRKMRIERVITDCDFIIAKFQYASRKLKVKPDKYARFVEELLDKRKVLLKWRKSNAKLKNTFS